MTRTWIRGAVLGSLAVVAVFTSCKEEGVRIVTLQLGSGEAGSAGFGCLEDPNPGCQAMLECALTNATQAATVACLRERCSDAGADAVSCGRVFECVRDGRGAVNDCYEAICNQRPPLLAQAEVPDGGPEVHLYVDYVGLGGTPGCRVSELRAWCQTGRCHVLRRRCLALSLAPGAGATPETASAAIAAAFAGSGSLDLRAPDEPVSIRVVGVARRGPCEPAEEVVSDVVPFDGAVGCAYSCPTTLTAVRGSVSLDLDTLGRLCSESDLRGCFALLADGGGAR